MNILPLRLDLVKKLKKAGLSSRYQKQKGLFENNHQHPSLHTEKLKPTHLNIHSFRINKKWRAIFIILNKKDIEVVDVNPHYNQ